MTREFERKSIEEASVDDYPIFLLPSQLRTASGEVKREYLLRRGHTEESLTFMCRLARRAQSISGVDQGLLRDVLTRADDSSKRSFALLDRPGRGPEE